MIPEVTNIDKSYDEMIKMADHLTEKEQNGEEITDKELNEMGELLSKVRVEPDHPTYDSLTEEERKLNEEGKELEDNRGELSFLINVIRAIKVPKKDGSYKHITNPMKILEIIDKYLPPVEVEMLSSIFTEIQKSYGVEFTVKKAVCPSCGNVTETIPVTPDELVFYTRQRLNNTSITVNNFQDL